MRNPTVKEVIEELKKLNQNAIVCKGFSDGGFSSIELVRQENNATYTDDDGNDAVGDIVWVD